MNRLFKSLALILLSVSLFSCGNSPSTENSATTQEPQNNGLTATQDSVAYSANASSDIQLNTGEKWLINDEMKPYIAQGQAALNDYVASNGKDYKGLAVKLKDADDNLISNCTMEGASHDELHKWLRPHLELVNKLTQVQNPKEANDIVKELKKSYDNFWIYFQ